MNTKNRTTSIILALLTIAFVGCSRQPKDAAAQHSEHAVNIDFASLTNDLKIKTSEPIISVEKIDGNFIKFIITTGSTSQSHHYVATWIHSQWSINPLVK